MTILTGIADGLAASAAFLQLASGSLADPEEVDQLRAALLAYCQRDTMAMVEVHRALAKLACQRIAKLNRRFLPVAHIQAETPPMISPPWSYPGSRLCGVGPPPLLGLVRFREFGVGHVAGMLQRRRGLRRWRRRSCWCCPGRTGTASPSSSSRSAASRRPLRRRSRTDDSLVDGVTAAREAGSTAWPEHGSGSGSAKGRSNQQSHASSLSLMVLPRFAPSWFRPGSELSGKLVTEFAIAS